MSTVLITGASGFIGQALAAAMSVDHDVLCMSRHDPDLSLPWIRGEFGSFEDLRQLDDQRIDVVVHLGAVTGGCLEHDGMLVNVDGTRCLMRYLIDRGCRKFVMASSIAAVGFQSTQFRPLQVPIPDEHPCFDRDGYGFSKYLMEEVTRYYSRQNDEIDVINLRLSSVPRDEDIPPPKVVEPLRDWSLGGITIMARSDAVRAFSLAAEASHKPGVRIMNAAGPKSWVAVPVVEILRNWWGHDMDLSFFEESGHEYDSVYDVSRIKQELGFVAERVPDRDPAL
jgi:nucleoside-diphosphate-sugar epimerase